MKVKTLETVRTFQGFTLKQIKRDGMIAIYQKTCKKAAQVIGYEVIHINIRKVDKASPLHANLKEYDFYEVYPSSGQFGIYGWDIGGKDSLERAMEKFEELKNRE